MSLRLKINLIMATVVALLVSVMIWLQVMSLRDAVREEIQSTNRVTVQLLNRLSWVYATYGHEDLLQFLHSLGRVRANEITLTNESGQVLYQSPPFTYKQGREAPQWFADLMLPPHTRHEIRLRSGLLTVEAEPSRAVLDGWDDLVKLVSVGAVMLALACLLVFWVLGRMLEPFSRIVQGLNRLQQGDFSVELPPLHGQEARAIGAAFNRLTQVLQDNIAAHLRVKEAESQLSDSLELANLIESHMEAERREIANALHDELGQSVTAISSLAMTVARRCESVDAQAAQAAHIIMEEASRLFNQMHGLIPKLAPMVLDSLGLGEALQELVQRARMSHPQVEVLLQAHELPQDLPSPLALTAYRIAQEGLTNALRHSHANRVIVQLSLTKEGLEVSVVDNGDGPPQDWHRPGHFGLRWLEDRARALGGKLRLLPGADCGATLRAWLPLEEKP